MGPQRDSVQNESLQKLLEVCAQAASSAASRSNSAAGSGVSSFHGLHGTAGDGEGAQPRRLFMICFIVSCHFFMILLSCWTLSC